MAAWECHFAHKSALSAPIAIISVIIHGFSCSIKPMEHIWTIKRYIFPPKNYNFKIAATKRFVHQNNFLSTKRSYMPRFLYSWLLSIVFMVNQPKGKYDTHDNINFPAKRKFQNSLRPSLEVLATKIKIAKWRSYRKSNLKSTISIDGSVIMCHVFTSLRSFADWFYSFIYVC